MDYIDSAGNTTLVQIGEVVGHDGDGIPGDTGSTGGGYTRATIGSSYLYFDVVNPNGSTVQVNVGEVVGHDGADSTVPGPQGSTGEGYTRATIGSSYLYFDVVNPDGSITAGMTIGEVVGKDGEDGDDGDTGSTGGGYTRATVGTVGEGRSYLYMDVVNPNGSITAGITIGEVRGHDGDDGDTGATGGGYTGATIRTSILYMDYFEAGTGAVTEVTVGTVGGPQGTQGIQGIQGDPGANGLDGNTGSAGPGYMFESVEVDGWGKGNNLKGQFDLQGDAPANSMYLSYYDGAAAGWSSGGFSGGLKFIKPAVNRAADLAEVLEFNMDSTANGGIPTADGSEGATITQFRSNLDIVGATGKQIFATKMQQADGSYKTLADTAFSQIGTDVVPPSDEDLSFQGYNILSRKLSAANDLSAGPDAALTVDGTASFAHGLALSGSTYSPGAAVVVDTNGTVDLNGTLTSSYAHQSIPSFHGDFIWMRFDVDSNTGTTSNLGRGITDTADLEVNKSIQIGATAGDNTFQGYTIGTADDGIEFDVGASVGVYKVTLVAVVANSAVNPTMTLKILRNGTAVHTVSNNSYSVISPQTITMEWIGATRSTWPISVECDASTGNATLMAGTTLSIVRIA